MVGGGPGFEFVGLALLAQYLRSPIRIDAVVLDIEPQWAGFLERVVDATVATDPYAAEHIVSFVQSDCLTGAAGAELEQLAPSMDLFTFNYVCVENARALR